MGARDEKGMAWRRKKENGVKEEEVSKRGEGRGNYRMGREKRKGKL